MLNKRQLIRSLLFLYMLTILLNAKEYTNTSYYVAYDENDKTQFALVMPSVQKVYTHQAGKIGATDLSQIDTQFKTFPTYDKGELCFSALKEDASGDDGASLMAENCYDVNFFYTQKEMVSDKGVAFILVYIPTDTVYEGLAGKSDSFKVVKSGATVYNENSITDDDYRFFSFNTDAGKIVIDDTLEEAPSVPSINATPTAHAGVDQNVKTTALVTLDGSASSDADLDSLTYLWSITSKPEGSTITLSNESVVNPTSIADINGAYVFSLLVNDGTIDSRVDSVIIHATTLDGVPDVPSINATPTAHAGVDQNVKTTELVTLDGSTS